MISCNIYSIPIFGINLNILECKYARKTLITKKQRRINLNILECKSTN